VAFALAVLLGDIETVGEVDGVGDDRLALGVLVEQAFDFDAILFERSTSSPNRARNRLRRVGRAASASRTNSRRSPAETSRSTDSTWSLSSLGGSAATSISTATMCLHAPAPS